jgi:ribulose-5-phosphate 4-epimerase/fuculose-1-phosphate aldolase
MESIRNNKPLIEEIERIAEVAGYLWTKGWAERNGGNISVNITLSDSSGFNALTALSVDDSAKKQRDGDYAVKLYFGTDKENIWDIAKRFSTEVEAIMEENDLSDTTLENGRMLLIPIKE